jgi:hypothetical protein
MIAGAQKPAEGTWRIANITPRLTERFNRVTGACILLDKVGGGVIAKPRSQIITRERGMSV